MKTKTTATKKKAATSKKKSTNKSQVAVARAMPVHVPTTNATTLQLQQRLAYIQQLEQLDQSNAQLRQMMNAQMLASQQQQMGSNNRSTTGVVLSSSTPSQLQHLQQQVVAAQINRVNNRKDMIHQIDKEIRAKIPSVQEKKKKSSSSEDKVEKVVIKAEQLFHLSVSPGRLGLTIAMNPNGGATITVIDPICTFASKINVGDRIVTIDGKDVLTLDDIKNGKDRARTFGIMQKVKESDVSTTVQKGPKEMEIAAKMAKNSKETSLTAAAALQVAEMSKDIVHLSTTQAEKKSQLVTQADKKSLPVTKAEKKTKKQKDPNKPKGWKSAYIFCRDDVRPIVKAANPDLSFRELPKKLGEYWQALSKEERAPYEKMAAADKERYDREMAVYNAKKNGSGEAAVAAASKVDTSKSQEGKKKRKREVVDTSDDKAVDTSEEVVVEEGNANKRLKHEGFFTRVFNKIKGIFS